MVLTLSNNVTLKEVGKPPSAKQLAYSADCRFHSRVRTNEVTKTVSPKATVVWSKGL